MLSPCKDRMMIDTDLGVTQSVGYQFILSVVDFWLILIRTSRSSVVTLSVPSVPLIN